jgi:hypothetical protein
MPAWEGHAYYQPTPYRGQTLTPTAGIFALIKKDMAQMLMHHIGADKIPGFDAADINMVAIQRRGAKPST